MGKSAKKSASEVAPAAVVAPAPTKPLKQGKRATEDVVEKKAVSAKKQKVGGKKGQIKAKEIPKKKASSSDDEDSEEDIKAPAKNGNVASEDDSDALAKDESSDEDAAPEKSDSEDDSAPDEETSDEENSEEDGTDEEDAPAAKKTKKTETPSTPKEKSTGSKTLFVGNLAFSVGESDIENFFKSAGEVVAVRLATGADNKFRGFGHVEFATPEQAAKALEELNGHDLLGREVRLDLARERGQSGGDRSGGGRSGDSGRGRGRGRGRFGDSGRGGRGRGRGRSGDSGRGGRGRR